MKKYLLTEETLGYVTAESPTNTDPRNLVAGSRNVIIDRQRKVRTRNGNSRLGVANSAVTPVRGGFTWNTSSGTELMFRGYDDEFEIYLGTVDGQALNAFYRVAQGFDTTAKPRFATWYSASLVLDLLVFVWGDSNTYAWNGAMCVVDSVTATTITKKGTTTFAQARFYTSGTRTLVNTRTGTEYTYSGGETSLTLTGVSSTADILAGDVLVQKITTNTNSPTSNRVNTSIFSHENQILVGASSDQLVYVSKNTSYIDFTYSAPRVAGEGALLTLDNPVVGFTLMPITGEVTIFAGKDSLYVMEPKEITVGSTLTETLDVTKYTVGVNQGAQSQETIVNIGSSILYLSHEPAVREIVSRESIQGGNKPTTLSNPIKPDFDDETWDNACAQWFKNAFYLSAPTYGHLYILEFVEDADGKLRRFWQAPQTMFIGPMSAFGGLLYGHSGAVAETYQLFDPTTFSDVNSDDEKMPIHCVAKFAYGNFGSRSSLKNFDEYFVEGEITPSTQLLETLYYNFGGSVQTIEKIIDGSDVNILEQTLLSVSLAQQPLGQKPLGGALDAPDEAAKFRDILELAREDFFELQVVFETGDVDKFWSIIARGPNAKLSNRQPNNIKT